MEKILKVLVVTVLIQTFLLSYLIIKINSIDTQAPISSVDSQTSTDTKISNKEATSSYAALTNNILDKNTLEQIIRTELEHYFNKRQNAVNPTGVVSSNNQNNEILVSSADKIENAAQQINLILASGDTTPLSMQDLTVALSHLSPSDRKKALSRLARGMTEGQIKNVDN